MQTITVRKRKCRVPKCPDASVTRHGTAKKTSGLCARHRQRLIRTGSVGSALSMRNGLPTTKVDARRREALEVFHRLVKIHGTTMLIVTGKPGSYHVTSRSRPKGKSWRIATILNFQRRGWLKISAPDKRLVRTARAVEK